MDLWAAAAVAAEDAVGAGLAHPSAEDRLAAEILLDLPLRGADAALALAGALTRVAPLPRGPAPGSWSGREWPGDPTLLMASAALTSTGMIDAAAESPATAFSVPRYHGNST